MPLGKHRMARSEGPHYSTWKPSNGYSRLSVRPYSSDQSLPYTTWQMSVLHLAKSRADRTPLGNIGRLSVFNGALVGPFRVPGFPFWFYSLIIKIKELFVLPFVVLDFKPHA